MVKLFIVGFPRDVRQIALVELFSIHGTVKTITLVTDKVTGEPKGYGFITMNDNPGATRAIQALNGTTICGRTISVRFAEEKQGTKLNVIEQTYPGINNGKYYPKIKRPRRT